MRLLDVKNNNQEAQQTMVSLIYGLFVISL